MKPGRGVAGAALPEASISHHSEEMHAHQAVPFLTVIAFLKERKDSKNRLFRKEMLEDGLKCCALQMWNSVLFQSFSSACWGPGIVCVGHLSISFEERVGMLTLMQEQAGKAQARPEGSPLYLGRCCFHRNTSVFFSLWSPLRWHALPLPKGIWKEKPPRGYTTYWLHEGGL